jgi:hypothetical protein
VAAVAVGPRAHSGMVMIGGDVGYVCGSRATNHDVFICIFAIQGQRWRFLVTSQQ